MTIPWHQPGTSVSSRDLPSRQQKSIKEEIKDLLLQVGRTRLDELCPRCGRQMEYVDTAVWFYGDDETFRIRLPACHCAVKEVLP